MFDWTVVLAQGIDGSTDLLPIIIGKRGDICLADLFFQGLVDISVELLRQSHDLLANMQKLLFVADKLAGTPDLLLDNSNNVGLEFGRKRNVIRRHAHEPAHLQW